MKVTTLSAVVMAGVGMVAGQNFGNEPSCAIPCLTSAFSVAGCALDDQGCQCGTGKAAIQTAVTPCFLAACSPQDLNSAASIGLALCSAYSLTAGGMNATMTMTSSTSMASSTSMTTTGSLRNGTIIMTAPPTTSTVTAKTTSVGSGSGSKNGSSVTTGTGTGKASGTSASVASTSSAAAAAPMLGAGIGGLVGVLGAVVAAL